MAKAKVETEYSVSIKEVSKELSPKERVMIKDTSDAIKLDEATKVDSIVINLDYYAVLNIHNSKADPVDYENFLIIDKEGQKYVTGSKSFFTSFLNIVSEMADVKDEEWGIKVYRLPSKNYSGKDFITCSLV